MSKLQTVYEQLGSPNGSSNEFNNFSELADWAADYILRLKHSNDEWFTKTKWVQDTIQHTELGVHLADILKRRIETLKTEVDNTDSDGEYTKGYYRGYMDAVRIAKIVSNAADIKMANLITEEQSAWAECEMYKKAHDKLYNMIKDKGLLK